MASDKVITTFVATCQAYVITSASVTLLSSNPHRTGWICQNTSGVLYIKLGEGCTPENYSYRLPTSAVLEDTFQGPISACVSSGIGFCFITEKL